MEETGPQSLLLSEDTPLGDIRFVGFDVETTGLSAIACRLVELSGVAFDIDADGEVETFSRLINPLQPIPPEVSALHGITDEMVESEESAAPVLLKFFQFLAKEEESHGKPTVLVAHNAAFDVEFVKVESLRAGFCQPPYLVLDTLTLCQALLPSGVEAGGPPNNRLQTLSEYFGFAGDGYHRALADSVYVQKLLQAMVKRFAITDISQFYDIGALKTFAQWTAPVDRSKLSKEIKVHLGLLEAAIEGKYPVHITYQGQFSSTRIVRPQAVIESRGSLYLSAFCLKSKAERTFRVDRIVKAERK